MFDINQQHEAYNGNLLPESSTHQLLYNAEATKNKDCNILPIYRSPENYHLDFKLNVLISISPIIKRLRTYICNTLNY